MSISKAARRYWPIVIIFLILGIGFPLLNQSSESEWWVKKSESHGVDRYKMDRFNSDKFSGADVQSPAIVDANLFDPKSIPSRVPASAN